MADINDPAEAALRLERALDRIAELAGQKPAADADSPPHAMPERDPEAAAEVARRLDALIGRIRTVLGPQAGG